MSAPALRSLLVAEPKFRGPLHATFNAGLVAAGAAAAAGGRVGFAAEPRHLAEVRAALEASQWPSTAARVDWLTLDIGPPGGAGRLRNLRVGRRVLDLASRAGFAATIFASTSGYQQLLALTLSLRVSSGAGPALVVVHDNWSDFVDSPSSNPLRRLKHRLVKALLRELQPTSLRLVVLQRGLRQAAQAASRGPLPRFDELSVTLLPPVGSLLHPPRTAPRAPGSRRIALAGVAGKGPSEWFAAAAERITEARFVLAGSARRGDALLASRRIEAVSGGERLDISTYREALAAADFGVVLLDPETYEWRISASALDLLAPGLPGIFNRCAFIERLFAEHGPVGWICDDRDAFLALVARLAVDEEIPEYAEFSRNCVRALAAHAPERVGERMRDLLGAAAPESAT